ncbi:hypothetical protein [Sphingobacterium litopenaei]|uniref:Uncharacterized protein n=1 Tax=Sphingobacterium litopenaei TaxID=2763500 RepID=A0ABR7YI16_9SPHI|nr:hypothetical protein [Sphingobacterium litopenaei]MBD1430911.1 hypothetical protein [Sphingobacterium litopenaei]
MNNSFTEENFFTNFNHQHAIMSVEEFNQLRKRCYGSELSKLARLLDSLSKLESYELISSVQVNIIFPNYNKAYPYEPPYFSQLPKVMELTDLYRHVSLNIDKLIRIADEVTTLNNNATETYSTDLLEFNEYLIDSSEPDEEINYVSDDQIKNLQSKMASGDRLNRALQMLNNL